MSYENLNDMLAGRITFDPTRLTGEEIELYEDIQEYKDRIEELEEINGQHEYDLEELEEEKEEELEAKMNEIEALQNDLEEERSYYRTTLDELNGEIRRLCKESEEKQNMIEELEGKLEACENTFCDLQVRHNALLESINFD